MLILNRKYKNKEPVEKRTLDFYDQETGEYIGKMIFREANTANEVSIAIDFPKEIGITRAKELGSVHEERNLERYT